MEITQEQRDRGFEAMRAGRESGLFWCSIDYTHAISPGRTSLAATFAAFCDERAWELFSDERAALNAWLAWYLLEDADAPPAMPPNGLQMLRAELDTNPRFPRRRQDQPEDAGRDWEHIRARLRCIIDTELAVRKEMACYSLYTGTKVGQALELPSRLGARGAGEARDLQRYIGTFISPLLAPRLLPAL